MPLYQYICNECDGEFEIRHKYGAKNVVCSKCNSVSITKYLGNKTSISNKTIKKPNTVKIGHEVSKAIEEGKRDLAKAKKELSTKRESKNE